MIMYVLTAEKILPHQPGPLNPTFRGGIIAVSILIVFATMLIRLKLVGTALDTLRSTPDDPSSLAKWRKGVILSDMLLEVIVLYGFMLRFMGGSLQQSLPFYAVGIGLMIVWWPQRP